MIWKEAYLESRVLSAEPLELVRMLYQHALESVRTARRCLAAGEIAARSRAVCQAITIVSELNGSLNHAVGGEISRNLANLYDYMRQRLTAGNMRQQDAPLAEVEALLTTLAEAWNAIQVQTQTEASLIEACPEPLPGLWREEASAGVHTWNV